MLDALDIRGHADPIFTQGAAKAAEVKVSAIGCGRLRAGLTHVSRHALAGHAPLCVLRRLRIRRKTGMTVGGNASMAMAGYAGGQTHRSSSCPRRRAVALSIEPWRERPSEPSRLAVTLRAGTIA